MRRTRLAFRICGSSCGAGRIPAPRRLSPRPRAVYSLPGDSPFPSSRGRKDERLNTLAQYDLAREKAEAKAKKKAEGRGIWSDGTPG